jgi:hypothetical protein
MISSGESKGRHSSLLVAVTSRSWMFDALLLRLQFTIFLVNERQESRSQHRIVQVIEVPIEAVFKHRSSRGGKTRVYAKSKDEALPHITVE